ncbi:Clp protease N-terminal domain-containing protein [Jiangella alba]|uniref:Clp amino terminal domain-containing protein, pathogenicity island component n=1 Tax=Jiangella alba TaxID=561176 RepID=A0A1H5DSV4_9ACTN|nr:Clp protease N-terminal domain-containing protein [Jiangella alba]SED81949.1 Clp amino terminal domain-containing protein, pathogenicity island component [Jiangella alba]
MPKINVYLPDDLADAVKAAGVPVSAICQRALEQSVRRMNAIRAATLGDMETGDPAVQFAQFTDRARTSVSLAVERARSAGAEWVGTEHLLGGLLDEGGNLALRVLRAMDVDPAQVARALAAEASSGTAAAAPASQFSGPAAAALELSVTEALTLGHNYVGCEHLLLGLLGEPDGAAGQVLRDLGVDLRTARQTVVAALTGYSHLRAQTATQPADAAGLVAAAVRQELAPVLDRIDRLERQAGLTSGD